MKLLPSVLFAVACLVIKIVSAETDDAEVNPDTDWDNVKNFADYNDYFDAGNVAGENSLLCFDLVGFIKHYVNTGYQKHPALPIVKQGAAFILKDKVQIKTALKTITEHSKSRVVKIFKMVKMFGEIVKDELGQPIKLPDDKENKPEGGSEVVGETGDKILKLEGLYKDAKTLVEEVEGYEMKFKDYQKKLESDKNAKFEDYKPEDALKLTKMSATLVIGILTLNCECEAYKILIARTISHIAITCTAILSINKEVKLSDKDKDTAELLGRIKKVALKVASDIRPLTSTMIFKLILGGAAFIFVVIGIATVLVTRKVNEKEH